MLESEFVTVLVLRLAPLLPVPIGAYNYLYGATDLALADFAPAMFLGSLKPYAFDSYLGVVAKTVVDDAAAQTPTSSISDPVLIAAFAFFLAVGVVASEVSSPLDRRRRVSPRRANATRIRAPAPRLP